MVNRSHSRTPVGRYMSVSRFNSVWVVRSISQSRNEKQAYVFRLSEQALAGRVGRNVEALTARALSRCRRQLDSDYLGQPAFTINLQLHDNCPVLPQIPCQASCLAGLPVGI